MRTTELSRSLVFSSASVIAHLFPSFSPILLSLLFSSLILSSPQRHDMPYDPGKSISVYFRPEDVNLMYNINLIIPNYHTTSPSTSP